ncbi:MAG: hypothetical protein ABI442_16245 [Gemmatimonadaceae bacterium]
MGRLPLPPRVTAMTESDEPGLRAVNTFIDLLADIALADWIALGRALMSEERARSARCSAWATLDTTIAEQQLGVAAWYARDGIETASHLVRSSSSSRRTLSRAERQAFYAAQGAAEEAVLALLAREHLSLEDFDVLCAGCRGIVAMASGMN